MIRGKIILFFAGLFVIAASHSQDTIAPSKSIGAYPAQLGAKANQLNQKLDKKSAKLLDNLLKREKRMKARLGKIDSLKAAEVFGDIEEKYKQAMESPGSKMYISSLDTMLSSLKFLENNPKLLAGESSEKIRTAIDRVNGLQDQFQKAEDLKRFLKERRQYLKKQLGQSGFGKDLKKMNKQAFYYGEQLKEYKAMLKDKKKAERKGLEILSKTKPFKDFMKKNSMLASMFRMPADPGDPSSTASIAGLQTRAQVNTLVQQQVAAGGAGARQQFSQNIQAAQAEISQLKNKLMKAGAVSSDDEIPDFKPNNQRTKSFWQRIEVGTNIQSQKPNGYFPVTSDLGLSVGYKLNDKSIIGIGSSYKLGWGQNIRHIRISHQGVGLRSFADWKIKGSFWLSAGYEMNYRSEFDRIDELKTYSNWQQSGLVGVSKVISLKTKFFKKTKLQMMWDFLSYQQVPKQKAFIFRVGYSL